MKMSFNYWMVIVPALFALGLVLGYFMVLPGKEKALRRPFRWRSNLPVAVVTLSYGVITGVICSAMLIVESRDGFVELFGRNTLSAIAWAIISMIACGIAMSLATIFAMREMRALHKRQLKRRWTKHRGAAVVAIARAEAEGRLSASQPENVAVEVENIPAIPQSDIEAVDPETGYISPKLDDPAIIGIKTDADAAESKLQAELRRPAKVIQLPTAKRPARSYGKKIRAMKEALRGRVQGVQDFYDPMTLPDDAVRRYR